MNEFLKHLRIDSSEKRDAAIFGALAMGVLTHFGTKDLTQSFGILFMLAWLANLYFAKKE